MLAMLTMPFSRWLMLPIALVWLALFVADGRFKLKFKSLKSDGLIPALLCLSFVFVATMIGTIYTSNVAKAFADWECKLWIAVAPLCLLPHRERLTKRHLENLLLTFCLASLATALGNTIWSLVDYLQTGSTYRFYYIHATHFFGAHPTHPSYLAMYYTISWLIAGEFLLRGCYSSRWLKAGLWAALLYLPITIILVESKAGILIFALLFVVAVLRAVNYRKRRPVLTGIAVGALVLGLAGSVVVVKGGYFHTERLLLAVDEIRNGDRTDPAHGTMQRVVIWQNAYEQSVQRLPLGAGTGAGRDVMHEVYQAKGYTYILKKNYNCHNQYLQMLLGQGIMGIAALLLFIGYPLFASIRRKNFLLGATVAVFALNMLVESMLETRAGTDFIPFLLTLLLLWSMGPLSAEEDRKASIPDGRMED